MKQPFSILFALAAACLAADSGDWNSLSQLKPQDEITVVPYRAGSLRGRFESVSSEGITLTVDGASKTIPKDSVVRVSRRGKRHRAANIAVLAGVGGLIGAGAMKFGIACAETDDGCRNTQLAAIGGAAAGAAIGAALPAGWNTIYRSQK
ncbi:MAG: hypothetical protein U0Q16_21410 [Bryobacteraceae bacterium]